MSAPSASPREALPAPERGNGQPRSLRPRGGLPSGRAVIGGFLVAVAAVGTFVAYSLANAPPQTSYLVATADIAQGQTVDVGRLGRIVMHLPDPLSQTTYQDPDQVVGTVALAPIREGQLLQQGMLAATTEQRLHEVSFSVPSDRAFAGSDPLQPGEHIDVIATYSAGQRDFSRDVVRGALVLAVGAPGSDGLASRDRQRITVGLADPEEVVALTHALEAAAVSIVRVRAFDTSREPYRHYDPPPAEGEGASDGG